MGRPRFRAAIRDQGGGATGEEESAGKIIGVVATGPSLTKKDCQALAEICDEIVAVNDAWRIAPADHLYAADPHWWKHHIADISRDFDGKCWSQERNWQLNNADPAAWGIEILQIKISAPGLSEDPSVLHGGSNSGYQAIGLAKHLGAGRIILLGYDMHCHGGKSHWFGEHPADFNANTNYGRFIGAFETINPAAHGLEIINCTRKTALKCFLRARLEDL